MQLFLNNILIFFIVLVVEIDGDFLVWIKYNVVQVVKMVGYFKVYKVRTKAVFV